MFLSKEMTCQPILVDEVMEININGEAIARHEWESIIEEFNEAAFERQQGEVLIQRRTGLHIYLQRDIDIHIYPRRDQKLDVVIIEQENRRRFVVQSRDLYLNRFTAPSFKKYTDL